MLAALYVRVSTQEQKSHGLSVDSQIDALKKYCADKGYTIYKIYNDAGISGRKSYKNRPALQEMINDCADKKVQICLFSRLDRFFRSVSDYYECVNRMNGVPWRAIWEDYETETSAGTFKVNIMLSIAQAESDRTSERIKAVNLYRRQRGEFVGSASLGYKLSKGQLSFDNEIKDKIQRFFRAYLDTFVVQSSVREAGLHISGQQARRMLYNPVYAGVAGDYKCPAYITEQEHEIILRSLHGRKRKEPTPDMRTYYFSGLMICPDCGRHMTGNVHASKDRNGNRIEHKTYRCNGYKCNTCTRSSQVFESVIERFMLQELDTIIGDIKVKSELESESGIDVEKELKSLNDKLKRIGVRFEVGDIDEIEYRVKRNELLNQIDQIKKKKPAEVITLPSDWKEVYGMLDDVHKRAFWTSFIKSITFTGDGKHKRFIVSM